jgi:hypothetical protein
LSGIDENDRRTLHRGKTGDAGPTGGTGLTGATGAQGEQGEQGEQGDAAPIHPWRWRLLSIWIVLFSLAMILAYHDANRASQEAEHAAAKAESAAKENVRLSRENRKLLGKIQDSRTESCTRTYTVIQQILDISTAGRSIDAVARIRLNRMRELANPDNCPAQTSLGGG